MISLRDQRARVYEYDEAATEAASAADGNPQPTYTVLPSPDADQAWWARIEEPGGKELTVAEAAERQSPAVIAFADEAVIPLRGVVLLMRPDGGIGPLYRISSSTPRRLAREIAVSGVFDDRSLYTLVD